MTIEEQLHQIRIRFRWALIGYVILAIGILGAFLIITSVYNGAIENTRDGLALVRDGQTADCEARVKLGSKENCLTIAQGYDAIIDDLDGE